MHPQQTGRYHVWIFCMLLLGMALWGCGGDGDDVPSIAGTYRGSVQDSLNGTGTATLTIAQNGRALTETFQDTFTNPPSTTNGTVTGTLDYPSIALTVESPASPCPFSFTGTFVTSTRITGTYVPVNCPPLVLTGNIDVTRQ